MTVSPLTEVRTLATTEPKTLSQAHEALHAIVDLGVTKLREAVSADLAAKITAAAQNGVCGDSRVRTLPQAREKLAAIAALLPSTDRIVTAHPTPRMQTTSKIFVGGAAPNPIKIRDVFVQSPKDDADALRIYQTLAAPIRQDFYALHEQAIWRAYRGRIRPAAISTITAASAPPVSAVSATAGATTVHADLVAQYMSLTGQARSDFYAKHSRELFEAHRARSKHAPLTR
jgi:hypothetical protein